jgi:hypothetical protein
MLHLKAPKYHTNKHQNKMQKQKNVTQTFFKFCPVQERGGKTMKSRHSRKTRK